MNFDIFYIFLFRDWETIPNPSLFKKFLRSEPPQTVLLEGNPGVGKTTFLKQYAYSWSCDILDCHEKGKTEPCQGHAWMLVVYVDGGSITGTATNGIHSGILCNDHHKDKVMDYIQKDGNGVLVEYDAVDEVHNIEIREGISEYLMKSKNRKCNTKVFVSTRKRLGNINKSVIHRFLKLRGFTLEQGIEFIEIYLKEVHSSEKKDLLDLIKRKKEDLKVVLWNPLRASVFSELVARDQMTIADLEDLNQIKLYRRLEDHLIRRESESRGSDGKSHAGNFYNLCLECLLSDKRQIPQEMLDKNNIPADSPYHVFLTKHEYVDEFAEDRIYHTFTHDVLFEYFAARGLIDLMKCGSISTANCRAVSLLLSARTDIPNVMGLTFGFVTQYEHCLKEWVYGMVQSMIILQDPSGTMVKDSKEILDQLRELGPSILKKDFEKCTSEKLEMLWTEIGQTFNDTKQADGLKQTGFFAGLHNIKDLPKYVLQTVLLLFPPKC